MKPSHSWIYHDTEALLSVLSAFTFDNMTCQIVEAIVEPDGYTIIKMDGIGKDNEVVIYYSVN